MMEKQQSTCAIDEHLKISGIPESISSFKWDVSDVFMCVQIILFLLWM